jgi:hypothetical protein
MATNSSVSSTPEAPQSENSNRANTQAIKQKARAIFKDMSIDSESRAYIRFALETNDPWLPDLVQRVEQGENLGETFDFSSH